MFILLFYFLLNMKLIYSTLIVQDAGLYEIRNGDMAMVFFLTVENTYDFNIPVSVYNVECIEGDPYSDTAEHMYLLGGDMGFIDKKRTKNLTLIYPNLYLRNRIGKCLIVIHYQSDQSAEELRKEVYFESNKVFVTAGQTEKCNTCDVNAAGDCTTLDCVVKYSSKRSYFSKEFKMCQPVPECPPNTVYIPKSNVCRKLHEPVCKTDLEMIEDGFIESCHGVSNLINYECHHGKIINKTGECVCDEGWTTTTCLERAYHPTLNLYHLCNVELNSWERANREKLLMTILVLVILALAIAAKMLLAVCLLNWCCHFIKSRSKSNIDEMYGGSYGRPYSYCGDDACLAEQNLPENKSSRTIKVSFSNMDTDSSAGDSNVTGSDDEKDAVVRLCNCNQIE